MLSILTSLSIPHAGEETAEDLANHFLTITKIGEASLEEFRTIEGVGEVVAQSMFDWFQAENNKKLLAKLLAEVQIQPVIRPSKTNAKFANQSFVLTGTLTSLTRDQAKKLIKQHGGTVHSSVSTQTNFVIAGESAGSKLTEAQKLGVKTLTESELLTMIR